VGEYRRAVEIRDRLARERPSLADNRISLVRSHANLADACAGIGRMDLAATEYERAEPLLTDLTREFPDRVEILYVGHLLEKNRADFETTRGNPIVGCSYRAHAIRRLLTVLERAPGSPALRSELLETALTQSYALVTLDRRAAEWVDVDQVIKTLAGDANAIADLRVVRAIALARTGDPQRALAEGRAIIDGGAPPVPTRLYNAACAAAVASIAPAPEGETACELAVTWLRRARDAGFFTDPDHVANLVVDHDLDRIRSRPDFRILLFDLTFPRDPFAKPR
jgi:hypothetical protein